MHILRLATHYGLKKVFKGQDMLIFTPMSLLRKGYCSHCTRMSVRTNVFTDVRDFFEIFWCFFGIVKLVVLEDFSFFENNDIFGLPRPFLAIFLIYKGLLGTGCKSGDLHWKVFVCRLWIYIVVRPDLLFPFLKKAFVGPAD